MFLLCGLETMPVSSYEKRHKSLSKKVKSMPLLGYIINTVVIWSTRKYIGVLEYTDVICMSGFRRYNERRSDLTCIQIYLDLQKQ